jgi:hypothetical protein
VLRRCPAAPFVRTRRYMHKSQGASGTLRGISVPKISLGEACWRGSEKSCVDLWKSGIGAKAEKHLLAVSLSAHDPKRTYGPDALDCRGVTGKHHLHLSRDQVGERRRPGRDTEHAPCRWARASAARTGGCATYSGHDSRSCCRTARGRTMPERPSISP